MTSVILGATLLLGGGLRLFEDIGLDLIHLERLMVM